MLPMGVGWITVGVCGGVGIWLWLRWQRERNKPINRIRRQARQTAMLARSQARQTASELRERMPDLEFPDEAARPAGGLSTVLLSIAVLLWQQSQARSRRDLRSTSRSASRQARQAVSDIDWQRRLMRLKERWTPGRLEREKISISRR